VPVPRFLIAGVHSGVGKTTIATGIMASLRARGLIVQGFKVGPDYIDPSYHTYVTGRASRNLDTWLAGEARIPELFCRNTGDADVAVIEGVMGMFDGLRGSDDWGSSAHIARILECPVILVVDVRSMARSAAAIVHGYATMDPRVKVAGVILNKVGGPKHYRMVKEAIEGATGIRVVGALGRDSELTMPERHLGLVPMAERGDMQASFTYLSARIEESVDLDALLEIGRQAKELPRSTEFMFPAAPTVTGVRVAVARDEAFTFYYQDGLDLLTTMGVELVPFSPLHDTDLPPAVSGVIIGGGFPELFLDQLAGNQPMMDSIRGAAGDGMPIYAECGGLMYLCRAVASFDLGEYPLVGLVPAVCQMEKRLFAIGYVEATAQSDNLLCRRGETLRGHEFHYSKLVSIDPNYRWAFKLTGGKGEAERPEGFEAGNLLASYLHLHMAGNPAAAARFVARCQSWGHSQRGGGGG